MPEGININFSPPPFAPPPPPPRVIESAKKERNPEFHRENAVVGVPLENYTKKVPSEDGKYVVITTHAERIEKIKQPEEIEAEKLEREQQRAEAEARRKAENKMAVKVLAGIGAVCAAVIGWAVYVEHKNGTIVVPAEPTPELES